MNLGEVVRIFPVLGIACASLGLSACGVWQSVSDGTASAYGAVFHKTVKTLDVDLSARPALNAGSGGQPLSVAVRIYQLKDRKSFDAASYDDLVQDDRTVLAADLQDMASVIVAPGAVVNVLQPLRADTRYIAVAAFFRDVGGATNWRRVFSRKVLSVDDPIQLRLVGSDLVAFGDLPTKRPTQ